jgi:hypothetical protein
LPITNDCGQREVGFQANRTAKPNQSGGDKKPAEYSKLTIPGREPWKSLSDGYPSNIGKNFQKLKKIGALRRYFRLTRN